jgi:hypothetical protein
VDLTGMLTPAGLHAMQGRWDEDDTWDFEEAA